MAIDIKESDAKVKAFIKEHGINYTVLMDKDGKVAVNYKAVGIPYNLIIDQKGVIRYAQFGGIHEPPKELEEILKGS